MTVPSLKPGTYTQDAATKLPTLDPVNREVAAPYAPSNPQGKDAVEYLTPPKSKKKELTDAEAYADKKTQTPAQKKEAQDEWVVWQPKPKPKAPAVVAVKRDMMGRKEGDPNFGYRGMTRGEKAEARRLNKILEDRDKKKGKVAAPAAKSWDPKGQAVFSPTKMGGDLVGDWSPENFKSVVGLVDISGDGVELDFAATQKRVEAAFGVSGQTGNLSTTIKNGLVTASNAIGLDPSIGVMIEDSYHMVKDVDFTDVSSVTGLLSKMTGNAGMLDMLDVGGILTFVGGIADTMMEWGIDDLLDDLIDAYQDMKLKEKMWEELCLRGAARGDTHIVRKYGDKMGGSRRGKIRVEVIHTLMGSYRIKDDDTRSDTQHGADLINTVAGFDQLWDKDIDFPTVTSLWYYSVASKMATRVLRRTDRRVHAIAGLTVEKERCRTTILNYFPEAVI